MPHRQFLLLLLSLSTPLISLLQGCGGGVDTVQSEELPSKAGANSAGIRIEACVVDQYFIPNEGVGVRALSPDGRTLAYAISGRRGEVIVSVPASVPVALVVDRDGGEGMSVPAHDRDSVLQSCLLARDNP